MHKFSMQSLAAFTIGFSMMGASNAANVSVNVGDYIGGWSLDGGSGDLEFSASLVSALNATGTVVDAIAPGKATLVKNAAGTKYVSVSATDAQVSRVNMETTTGEITDVYTSGGHLQTAVDDGFSTTGGSLSITNMHADLINKKVYVDIVGANGVGSLQNYYLWDITSITGVTTWGPSTVANLTGLKITTDGFIKFSQAMGLTSIGQGALATVTDFGSLSVCVRTASLDTPTTCVPEASTYAYMMMGLTGIGITLRRRARSSPAA